MKSFLPILVVVLAVLNVVAAQMDLKKTAKKVLDDANLRRPSAEFSQSGEQTVRVQAPSAPEEEPEKKRNPSMDGEMQKQVGKMSDRFGSMASSKGRFRDGLRGRRSRSGGRYRYGRKRYPPGFDSYGPPAFSSMSPRMDRICAVYCAGGFLAPPFERKADLKCPPCEKEEEEEGEDEDGILAEEDESDSDSESESDSDSDDEDMDMDNDGFSGAGGLGYGGLGYGGLGYGGLGGGGLGGYYDY